MKGLRRFSERGGVGKDGVRGCQPGPVGGVLSAVVVDPQFSGPGKFRTWVGGQA